MLRTFAVASLAIALSIGLAQAKGHRQRTPMCGEGQQATATCLCGVALGGHQCCARRGNGAMAGRCAGCVSARRRASCRILRRLP
jgi:hypothetical protein